MVVKLGILGAPAAKSPAWRLAQQVGCLGVNMGQELGTRVGATDGYLTPWAPQGGGPPAYNVTAPPISFFINAPRVTLFWARSMVRRSTSLQLAGGT